MIAPLSAPPIFYPESDGKRMAENTLQWDWIVCIKMGIMDIFADDPNIFIASDLLWYPVEGDPKTVLAPDVMVAFGRPPGYRGSYLQWKEDDIPPQVVFEVLSPSNTPNEMKEKLDFYMTHGVKEYYEFDPDRITLKAWQIQGTELIRNWTIHEGGTSPRLGIRFEIANGDLILTKPNGERFPTLAEANRQRREALKQAKQSREREEQALEAIRLAREAEETAKRKAKASQDREEMAKREAKESQDREEAAKRESKESQDREEAAKKELERERQAAKDAEAAMKAMAAELERLRAQMLPLPENPPATP
jgi:Uma2 family endonuclease